MRSLSAKYRISFVVNMTWILILFLVTVPKGNAQTATTGSVEGLVVNGETGAPLAGVLVTVINRESGVARSRFTDAKGRFYEGLLGPGLYTLIFSAPGF